MGSINSNYTVKTSKSQKSFLLLLTFSTLCIVAEIFGIFTVHSAEAAVDCANDSWTVGNEADLNFAITCFNNKTSAGAYTIILNQNIGLSASLISIDNTTNGVELFLEGRNFDINGSNVLGVRPFYIASETHVTMYQLVVRQGLPQSTGGAIFNEGTLNMIGSALIDNGSHNQGGAIYNQGAMTLTQTYIRDNTALNGGGIYNNGKLTIVHSYIEVNEADVNGGGIYNSSTGILTIEGSTIEDNKSFGNGGGLYNFAGDVIINSSSIYCL